MQLISDVFHFQAYLTGLNYTGDSSELLGILKSREKTVIKSKNVPHVGEFYFDVTSI